MKLVRYKSTFKILLAVFFVLAGMLHFLKTPLYVQVMPPYLPFPLELVYISGFFEILGGLGVLIPLVRRLAGYGLIALLIAVFPANIHMAASSMQSEGMSVFSLLLLLRLPLQLVFVAWVYWCTKEP